MDYSDIVLKGYYDSVTRKHLHMYFLRIYENNKNDFFEVNEFLDGCFQAASDFEYLLNNRVNTRKEEIRSQLENAKNSRGIFAKARGIYNDEKRLIKIAYYERELEKDVPDSTQAFRPVTNDTTNDLISIKIGFDDVQKIKNAIILAKEKYHNQNTNEVNIPTKKYPAKNHVLAYIFDMKATNQLIPNGEKKSLEKIGEEQLGPGRGNTFYKEFNKINFKNLNSTTELEKLLGQDWRQIILKLCNNSEKVEEYFKNNQL